VSDLSIKLRKRAEQLFEWTDGDLDAADAMIGAARVLEQSDVAQVLKEIDIVLAGEFTDAADADLLRRARVMIAGPPASPGLETADGN
jgi:hypothetical protein